MSDGPFDNEELNAAFKRANDWFNSLTPEQQAEHRAAQRKAWVEAEMAIGDEGTRPA